MVVAALLVACMSLPLDALADEVVNPWTNSASTNFSLLTLSESAAVRDELELTEDQIAALALIREERTKTLPAFFQQIDQLPLEERRLKMKELPKVVNQFDERAQELLIPLQRTRYSEIAAQMRMKMYSASGGLADVRLASFLGLSDQQKAAIREKAKKYEAQAKEALEKYRAELAKIAETAKRDMEAELDDSQLASLRRLIGKPFQIDTSNAPAAAPVGRK
jgi:hypothetical protein